MDVERVEEGTSGAESHLTTQLLIACCTLLLGGLGAKAVNVAVVADVLWAVATAAGLVFSVGKASSALRRREVTVDVIAILALLGALLIREWFAGAMIALMIATGGVLEARASARAARDLGLLVERAPRTARRRVAGVVQTCPVEDVAPGDVLIVGAGEVVPVDGRLSATSVLDESALTGEPLPVERPAGHSVRSGVVNAGQSVEMVATAGAADSTYAALVRLVAEANASSAPFVRVADRLAALFIPVTLVVASAAWVVGGSVRAVAVLVVATPCPLLLAAPIAFLSGLSRAARRGVVVKGAGALERLADAQTVIFDKTGTLTLGRPMLREIVPASSRWKPAEVLGFAASLDQVSAHVLADAIAGAAHRQGVTLHLPRAVEEAHGYGIQGDVDGHRVQIGKASWIIGRTTPDWVARAQRSAAIHDCMTVFVGVDGEPAGALLLEDRIRHDAARMISRLRSAGIARIVLLTGDRASAAERVGCLVGVDEVLAERDPAAKLTEVERESTDRATVMVGDGINDAPALAAAHLGVALAARGATASSEAADVVITADRVDVLADAVQIARRSKHIALQAVVAGMGLSLVAMGAAAAGMIPPAEGALGQEAIDVLAIGIALRAVLPDRRGPRLTSSEVAAVDRLQRQHDASASAADQVRAVADGLSTTHIDLAPCRALLELLERDVLPHERADEHDLLPIIQRVSGEQGTPALHRGHAEIAVHAAQVRAILTTVDDPGPADVIELRRILYGLYAVLRLHNAQEEDQSGDLTAGA